jgi:hypothetical protein
LRISERILEDFEAFIVFDALSLGLFTLIQRSYAGLGVWKCRGGKRSLDRGR